MAQPPIFSYERLSLHQGEGWLFQDLDLHVGPRDRLALIGRNGAGKTTLLRLIADQIEPDKGKRMIQPGVNIVMLEQEPDFTPYETLLDFAISGNPGPAEFEVQSIADQLSTDLSIRADKASGGEKRRAAICRALALEPDLLLLDEPTNHLDLGAIDWLEDWLRRYKGAFITISHDRTFLTRLTKQTIWLDRGALRRQEIGFGGYDAWMEKVHADEAQTASKIDAKLKLEARWLERGVTARRKRNQGRLQKLYEMRAARAAMIGPAGTANLKAQSDDVRTKSVITAENISKSFGEGDTSRTIIRDFSLRIQRGDRIGIVGANGAGKTTLLKMLTGKLEPDSGSVTLAKTLNAVFIDQQRSLLEDSKTVRDIIADGSDWVDVRGEKKHVQGYLKDFLFAPSLIDAKVGTLSGGEQSRLLLAREFARMSNLLVLDEPTNDLDLETLDLLQEVISDYDGTVLLVSHDRDFLDRTVTVTLGLDGSGKVDIIAGGYAEWEAKRKADKNQTKTKGGDRQASSKPAAKSTTPAKKLSYKDQRDFDMLPDRIDAIDKRMAEIAEALADADLYTKDFARFEKLTEENSALIDEKDEAEMRWLELAEQIEQLQK
ncbi:ABC-F family ATP-binding cassette domain-containing protein [Parasphingorhabdus sp. JC815]|uniref:ABC-F family ATP-binding cassette domain-containing protein n=1 Tax=Parasphingorhabdus sp. JC815 TaxID=3232140 RepID=UPI0034595163